MRTRSRSLLSLGAVLVAVPLFLTPAAPARPTTQAAVTITVTLTDSAIRLSKSNAPVGKVTFSVRNTGKQIHDFKIGSKKTPILRRGKSAKLIVTFTKPGKVSYSSTRPGDARKGLKGTFTVKKAAGGGTASLAAGKAAFVSTGCGGCHVFKAGGGVGTVGPNLDAVPLSTVLAVNRITNGKGGMPSYRDQLTPKQIRDLANFLVNSKAR